MKTQQKVYFCMHKKLYLQRRNRRRKMESQQKRNKLVRIKGIVNVFSHNQATLIDSIGDKDDKMFTSNASSFIIINFSMFV